MQGRLWWCSCRHHRWWKHVDLICAEAFQATLADPSFFDESTLHKVLALVSSRESYQWAIHQSQEAALASLGSNSDVVTGQQTVVAVLVGNDFDRWV